jgi:inner membrane transporter RhtA
VAIEFLGTVVLAALGARSRRNIVALALTVAGVAGLTVVQVAARPLGIALAFGNCAGFMLYVVLGHRVANTADTAVQNTAVPNTAVPNTAVPNTAVPNTAVPDTRRAAAIDQLGAAMLIAAFAAITGAVVLGQIPTVRELAGIGLVIAGVALHRADAGPREVTRQVTREVKGRAGVPGS